MPELPEVETVVRDLRTAIVGRTIETATLFREDVVRYPAAEQFVAGLQGMRCLAVERRAKFIVCTLSSGDDLVVHLGMTGHLEVCTPQTGLRAHTHFRALLDDGRELRFADARRFGRLLLGSRDPMVAARALPALGMEPLGPDFTLPRFDALLRGTTRTLKSALLDQRGVAGLGNIYVDEICHLACVRPTRRCHRLTRRERLALFTAVPLILDKAIRLRGSSIDDYRDLWNAAGSMQEQLQVYGRAGEPCFRCGGTIRKVVVGGRGTHYCPACQR